MGFAPVIKSISTSTYLPIVATGCPAWDLIGLILPRKRFQLTSGSYVGVPSNLRKALCRPQQNCRRLEDRLIREDHSLIQATEAKM